MKIMLISHSPLISGGAEKSLLEYAETLKEHEYDCRVILPGKGEFSKHLKERGIKYSIVEYGWATKPHYKSNIRSSIEAAGRSLSNIYKVVKKYQPNVIITNTTVIPWGLYVGKELKVPTILLVHETLEDKQHVLGMEPNYAGYIDILDKNADYVIYNSSTTKESYDSLIKTPKISKALLFPVPNLKNIIDDKYISCKEKDKVDFAIIGSVQAEKNQIEVLYAVKEMIKKGVNEFSINIYGDGDEEYLKKINKYIKENNLAESIHMKGYSNNIYEEINKNNIIISPFKNESFGRAVIEGQLFGRLVIANDTGATSDLIIDGRTGLIYESGNIMQLAEKMIWAIDNQKEAIKIGNNARKIQRERYLSSNQYKALIDAVEYYNITSRNKDDNNTNLNRYSPISALSEYSNGLEYKYRHVYRITHNRITRKILHYIRALARRTRTLFKS